MNTQKWLVVIGVSLVLIVGVFVLLYSADTTETLQLPAMPTANQSNNNSQATTQSPVSDSDSTVNSPNAPLINQANTRSLAELEALLSTETEAIMAKIRIEAANRKYTDEEKRFLSDKKSFTVDKLLTEQKINADEAVLLQATK